MDCSAFFFCPESLGSASGEMLKYWPAVNIPSADCLISVTISLRALLHLISQICLYTVKLHSLSQSIRPQSLITAKTCHRKQRRPPGPLLDPDTIQVSADICSDSTIEARAEDVATSEHIFTSQTALQQAGPGQCDLSRSALK